MNYYAKYQKYKSKYLALQDEYTEYLYHGTSMFYLDDIRKNGFTGKYNPKLFDQMNKFYPIISNGVTQHKALSYFPGFIERQSIPTISLSFTGNIKVAKQYAGSERVIGEGPTFFTSLLRDYLIEHKEENTDFLQEMRILYDTLSKGHRYPPLILVIKIDQFVELTGEFIRKTEWEYKINFPIPPEKLLVYNPTSENYIPLLSYEFDVYSFKKMEIFEKTEEELRERIAKSELLLKVWQIQTNIDKGISYKYYNMIKGDMGVRVTYEQHIDDDPLKQYFQIIAINKTELINIVFQLQDRLSIRENNQIDDELQEKLNQVINRMLQEVTDQKEYYIAHIRAVLPSFILQPPS